jgi:hypothetical protein
MSEIRATTISNAAGTGPITLTGQSAAKAWVNFNGTSTVAIRDSENVSSITDNGTGLYTINFTSSMANGGYSVTNSVDGTGIVSGAMTEVNNYVAGNFRVRGMNPQSNYANTDFTTQSCSTHGDLA